MLNTLASRVKENQIIIKSILLPLLARFAILFVVVVVITSLNSLQLGYSQPSILEEAVIERTSSPSPTPVETVQKPTPIAKEIILETKENPTVKVGSENLSSLCQGVTEAWKLVPNPNVEGQYIVCNSQNGVMATVDELNATQNNYRVDHGLGALSINQDLCKIGRERAVEISSNFSHQGFEEAVERSGIQKSAIGENIASGPLTAIQFVEWAWDRSPGHRANMLADWIEGCAGVYGRFAVFIFTR